MAAHHFSLLDWTSTNAATGIVGAVAWETLKQGYGYARRRTVERYTVRGLWSFLSEPTHVFLPFSPAGRGAHAGLGDLFALSDLIVMAGLVAGSDKTLTIHSSHDDPRPHLGHNVVVIGGGRYNQAYLHFVDELRPPLHFWDTPETSNDELTDRDRKRVFSPIAPSPGEVTWDVALALAAPNPKAPGKQVVIVAGSHTYGTSAAMKYLTSSKGARAFRDRTRRHVVAIGCEVSAHRAGEPRAQSEVITW